ncbi:hypothetical protein COT78_01735 [Candidatus Berkelbacteria bacterium CG10_big_fil_rev_8_21_14_0_10_43_13]|uniref:Uncharacterized protein n=1 Tax=Candidatus Berkelbacteria bacterium CG10_big_fil_rev_8_21_14_0_10_43_13 TaxID=1974514 RepID=A0A2H0W6S9_9BACT|nr:MAG: hypothetical protein COT78_01735 [Candidatus Berkelbacteria bacterium CG10_big_fil_rev_8_21_14_0_10_43_13]
MNEFRSEHSEAENEFNFLLLLSLSDRVDLAKELDAKRRQLMGDQENDIVLDPQNVAKMDHALRDTIKWAETDDKSWLMMISLYLNQIKVLSSQKDVEIILSHFSVHNMDI